MIYKETPYLIFQNVWNFSTRLGHVFPCSKPHDHLFFLLVDLKFNLDILYLRNILYLSCIFVFHIVICLHILKKAYLTDADLTEQDSNLELKAFHIVLFLVSIFFPICSTENKNTVQNHNGNLSSRTFGIRIFWHNRWREVLLAILFACIFFQKESYSNGYTEVIFTMKFWSKA